MENLSEGRWLRSAIAEAGYSVAGFARKAGVSRESLNKWFAQPILQIRPDTLLKVLRGLGYTNLHYLDEEVSLIENAPYITKGTRPILQLEMTRKIMNSVRWRQEKQRPPEPIDQNVEVMGYVPEIPLFNLAVAAGGWVEVAELAEVRDPQMIDHGRFRVRIKGDSMQPRYQDGSIVEFVTVRFGRDDLNVGKNYYVQRCDGTATFKRLARCEEEQIVLVAINRKHYPKEMPLPWQEISRMARAVAILDMEE